MKNEGDAPADAPAPIAARPVSRSAGPHSAAPAIVLVDDDADTRELLTELLEDQGYQVRTAHNGADALIKLTQGALPTLIILDLNMPGLNGPDFVHRLLQDPTFGRVPVLVVSASVTGRQQAALLGADAFLEKPFHLPDLLEQVSRLVEGRLQCT
jgi:CheY-like chemotaxis protein